MIFQLFISLSFLLQIQAWYPNEPPRYCNKDTTLRKIPSLTAEQSALVGKLEQVQVVARHGSRTPWAKFPCWKDYDVSWTNCNVTELMLTSPSYTADTRSAPWLFRKLYDGSANYLGGNCYTGQLLYEGYQQEQTNGRYLYEAYLNSDLKLFPSYVWTDIDTDSEVYLRSDDAQRTLMSAQVILRSMFNVSSVHLLFELL
jgi:hypothetical protein